MKLTAKDLAVILDTLAVSLSISDAINFHRYSKESREETGNKIGLIMDELGVEILPGEPNFTIDADTGM